MIYLAQPYTHKKTSMITARFKLGEFMTYHYLQQGDIIYSPIVHSHRLAINYKLPGTFDWWGRYNRGMISCCKEVRVLQLPGWDKSVGVMGELEYARDQSIEVTFVAWETIRDLADGYIDNFEEYPLRFWTDEAEINL